MFFKMMLLIFVYEMIIRSLCCLQQLSNYWSQPFSHEKNWKKLFQKILLSWNLLLWVFEETNICYQFHNMRFKVAHPFRALIVADNNANFWFALEIKNWNLVEACKRKIFIICNKITSFKSYKKIYVIWCKTPKFFMYSAIL